ncbi:IS30 family transposase [Kribbella sp. NPDC051718]|uniref:IS30 family transposase n=1 Tax=Kribbella sp. NPDC051718 TaxID=3155168 RepID=UPI003439E479
MRTARRPLEEPAYIRDASTPTLHCMTWWRSGCRSVGVHSSSAGIFGSAIRDSRRCGCVTRVSTRPSTNLERRWCARRRSRLSIDRRCAPDETTDERIRRPSVVGPLRAAHAVHPRQTIPPQDRSEAGHWEGDLIIGKDQASAIGTLIERTTRTIRLLHLPQCDSDALHAALKQHMSDLPAVLLRSITWDQGTEPARHTAIAATLGASIYFCDSRSPWQRGSNENGNGLLRQYFPKGTDLSIHTPEHLRAVENEINNRPRRVLEDRSPAELFSALLASAEHHVLQR